MKFYVDFLEKNNLINEKKLFESYKKNTLSESKTKRLIKYLNQTETINANHQKYRNQVMKFYNLRRGDKKMVGGSFAAQSQPGTQQSALQQSEKQEKQQLGKLDMNKVMDGINKKVEMSDIERYQQIESQKKDLLAVLKQYNFTDQFYSKSVPNEAEMKLIETKKGILSKIKKRDNLNQYVKKGLLQIYRNLSDKKMFEKDETIKKNIFDILNVNIKFDKTYHHILDLFGTVINLTDSTIKTTITNYIYDNKKLYELYEPSIFNLNYTLLNLIDIIFNVRFIFINLNKTGDKEQRKLLYNMNKEIKKNTETYNVNDAFKMQKYMEDNVFNIVLDKSDIEFKMFNFIEKFDGKDVDGTLRYHNYNVGDVICSRYGFNQNLEKDYILVGYVNDKVLYHILVNGMKKMKLNEIPDTIKKLIVDYQCK